MDSTQVSRGRYIVHRLMRHTAVAASAAIVAVMLATVLAGCGAVASSAPAASTPAPSSSAASLAAVWTSVAAEPELFGLVVTENLGFTTSECQYLRHVRVAWAMIRSEAASVSTAPASTTDTASATRPLTRIERQAGAIAAMRPPSPRFYMLSSSVRALMHRVVRMARISLEYERAPTDAEKSALVNDLSSVAAPLAEEAMVVADWGVEMRLRYSYVYVVVTPTTPATPVPVPPTPASPEPNPTPNPNPTSSPTSKPQAPLTAAEAKQVTEIEELDVWLTAVMTDTSAIVEAQSLPWTDEQVNSFSLNMSYLIDQCDHWLATAPAGPSIADGFRQYQRGLSLVRKGASQLESAALYNDSAHQKALNQGNTTLKSAEPDLKHGLSKMEAYR
jgi:hypothetical protein